VSTPDLLRCALPPSPEPQLVEALGRVFLREAIIEGIGSARKQPNAAAAALADWVRNARRLGSHDRPLVVDSINHHIRQEAFLLRAGAWDLPAQLDALARVLGGDRFEAIESASPAEDFSTALNVGYPLARAWLAELGPEEAAAFGQVQTTRAPLTVRANRLRCSREALQERLATEGIETRPTPLSSTGLHLLQRANFAVLDSYKEGWFEVQDESGQLLVERIPLRAGDSVLDLCAGAGGKALALAARGAVVRAYDIREAALEELTRRVERAGADVCIDEPAPARVVLVDAPCSGTGRLRREPTLRMGLRPGTYDDDQQALLSQAASLVEPGGVLVYATCSLDRSENERPDPAGFTLVEARTLWPHRDGTDGFAWRIWRREG
jgi:16S rRNA (cytosine967-C5)-methyltransferase